MLYVIFLKNIARKFTDFNYYFYAIPKFFLNKIEMGYSLFFITLQ